MPKRTKVKQLRKAWSLMLILDTKYLCWTPSIATIYKGHIWPIGISVKWLWFGISLVHVGKD